MDEQLFERVLAGEHGEDLSPAEAEAFEAWLETERGRELLAAAEGELDPIADAFQPQEPSAEAWEKVASALREQAGTGGGGVVVRVPQAPVERNWGLTGLIAAGLLFAAAVGLLALGPNEGGSGRDSLGAIGTEVATPRLELATTPLEEPATPPASASELEAGAGYEVASELVEDALLVITIVEAESR